MLDVYEVYQTDEKAENTGVWRNLGKAKLLVARAGNKAYSKMLSRLVEENQRDLDLKDDAAEVLSDSIMQQVLAATVLLDWQNVGFKGEILPYCVENAKTLLAVKDFRAQVSRLANEAEAFKLAKSEQAGKPSGSI